MKNWAVWTELKRDEWVTHPTLSLINCLSLEFEVHWTVQDWSRQSCVGDGNLDFQSCPENVFVKHLKWKWKSLSHVRLFVTPWTVQSMEFSRPEYWCGQPFPSPGDLPNPEIKPRSPAFHADSLPAEPQGKPKNTGVGSLSLLQKIFLIQELNRGK